MRARLLLRAVLLDQTLIKFYCCCLWASVHEVLSTSCVQMKHRLLGVGYCKKIRILWQHHIASMAWEPSIHLALLELILITTSCEWGILIGRANVALLTRRLPSKITLINLAEAYRREAMLQPLSLGLFAIITLDSLHHRTLIQRVVGLRLLHELH